MSPLIVLLRLLHILSAVVWLGGSFLLAAFVVPTAKRLGPDGTRFMQSLAGESRLPVALTLAGWIATLAGAILFVFVSGRFDRDWLRSPMGTTFTIGALFGLSAALYGSIVPARLAARLAAVSREIARAGGSPTPEQLARVDALRDGLARSGVIGTTLLFAAASAMAIARYV